VYIKKQKAKRKVSSHGTKSICSLFTYCFYKPWKSQWFGEFEYSQLLAQDYQLRRFLDDVFIVSQLPTSELIFKRLATNLFIIKTSIFIPLDKRNSLLFFRQFFQFDFYFQRTFNYYFLIFKKFTSFVLRKIRRQYRNSTFKSFSNFNFLPNEFLKRMVILFKKVKARFFKKLKPFKKMAVYLNSSYNPSWVIRSSMFSKKQIAPFYNFYMYPSISHTLTSSILLKPKMRTSFSFMNAVNVPSLNDSLIKPFAILYKYLKKMKTLNKMEKHMSISSTLLLNSIFICLNKVMLSFNSHYYYINKMIERVTEKMNAQNITHVELQNASLHAIRSLKRILKFFYNRSIIIPKKWFVLKSSKTKILSLLATIKEMGIYFQLKLSQTNSILMKALLSMTKQIIRCVRYFKQSVLSNNGPQESILTYFNLKKIKRLRQMQNRKNLNQFILALSHTMSNYVGASVTFLPRIYYATIPKIKSAKMLSMYIKYEMEKNIPMFEILRTIRQWSQKAIYEQNSERMKRVIDSYKKVKDEKDEKNEIVPFEIMASPSRFKHYNHHKFKMGRFVFPSSQRLYLKVLKCRFLVVLVVVI
jgi:hypothetical protein